MPQVSISDFLTLFSARTHNGFFWSDRPSPFLAGAAVLSLAISTIVACFWGDGVIDGQHVRGLALKSGESSYTLWALWIWIYCIIWWFIQVGFGCVRVGGCGWGETHAAVCVRRLRLHCAFVWLCMLGGLAILKCFAGVRSEPMHTFASRVLG